MRPLPRLPAFLASSRCMVLTDGAAPLLKQEPALAAHGSAHLFLRSYRAGAHGSGLSLEPSRTPLDHHSQK